MTTGKCLRPKFHMFAERIRLSNPPISPPPGDIEFRRHRINPEYANHKSSKPQFGQAGRIPSGIHVAAGRRQSRTGSRGEKYLLVFLVLSP